MANIYNLAFDLGASSGRLILSAFDGEKITLKELHRFLNEPVEIDGILCWDMQRLLSEMKTGLRAAAALGIGNEITGIGIDSWGVDYVLLDENGNIMGQPISYRDNRTQNCIKDASAIISLDDIYNSTGIQLMEFNTLFQWIADKHMRSSIYENAKYYLSIPDYINYILTGEKHNEYTHASTTQAISAKERKWDFEMLSKLGLRKDLFCSMVYPGTQIGCLTIELQSETGLPDIPVYAVGSHDTASAVAGTPFTQENAAFLSCGTWSLFGVELNEPLITQKAFDYNFTNEGGVYNTIRFLKNINGLWILQQLRKCYNENNSEKVSFPDIINAAMECQNNSNSNSNANKFCIDPSNSAFMLPADMAKEIADYCEINGQGRPTTLGELAIAVYNGLTKEYGNVVKALEDITGKSVSVINMIGGGIQDSFLCGLTAKETGKTVVAGPIEGSVMGNVIIQLIAGGYIENLSKGREIAGDSFELKTYKPL